MSTEGDLAARAQGRIGTVLRGKYRLDRVLGVGGMAVVYKATHRNEAEFAVKMLHPELSIREDVRTRFLREGKAANSVKHPGAVLVVDDDVAEDGAAFIVMELLDGCGVEALWEGNRHRLPVRPSLAIAHQLLDVLAAAHAKGIVHRDIKPANLFVTREGAVKVLDFGIARVRAVAASGAHATGSGMLLGTPAFMPPEQALAKASEIDGQTDVWAVGATLFSLLSGRYVHEGENAPQVLVKAATVPARSLAATAPELPAEVVHIVDRALAFEKAARWPTALAMRDAIRDAYARLFGEPISRTPLAAMLGDEEAAVTSTTPAAPVGGTTAQPVSSGPIRPAGVPTRMGGPAIPLMAAVAALTVVVAASAVGWRMHSAKSGVAATPAASTVASTTPSIAPMPSVLPAPSLSAQPAPAASSVAASTAPPARPTGPPGYVGRAPTKPMASAAASTPVVPPTPAPSAAPPVPPPTPTCRTVFDHYDSNYQPIYRQECK